MAIDTTGGSPSANSYVTLTEAGTYFEQDYAFQEDINWSSLATSLRESVLVTATRQIDAPRFRGTRLFPHGSAVLREGEAMGPEQGLAFPRDAHPYLTGVASDTSTATVLRDETLARPSVYPDDFFRGGSVYIRKGSNRFRIRAIQSYQPQAGEANLATAFPEALDSSSAYQLLYPIPSSVKRAQLAQAQAVLDRIVRTLRLQGYGVQELRVGEIAMEFRDIVGQATPVCPEALVYLSPYLASAACLRDGTAAAR